MNVIGEYYCRIASVVRLRRTHARARKAALNGITELPFGPCSLNLMMADVCNSQCIMCGHDYKACGSGRYLRLEDARRMFDHLDLSQVVDVIYGGGGEPFLNPELADIAAHTHGRDPVIQHTVITNGLSNPPEVVRDLLHNRVHFLVSVNAASQESFQAVAGVDGFERVQASVRRMVELRKKMGCRVAIHVSMILMKRTIRELPAFVRLAADWGVDGVKTLYARIYPPDYRVKNSAEVRMSEDESLFFHQQDSDRLVREAKETATSLAIAFDHEPLFADAVSRERECHEPWKSLFVNFNGDAYPCPASEILFMNKINLGRYASGNILKQPVMEFWNNPFWQALRRTNSNQGRQDIVPECGCCGNAICWNGVRARKSHILDWSVAEQSALKL